MELTILKPNVLNGVLQEMQPPKDLLMVNKLPRNGYPFPNWAYDVLSGSKQMAKPNVPNSEANIVQPLPIGKVSGSMLYTREKKVFEPTTLYWLRKAGEDGAQAAKRAESSITAETQDLNDRNERFLEYCIWQMLQGSLTLDTPYVQASIDYKLPADHKPTAGVLWNHVDVNGKLDADVIKDVKAWKRKLAADAQVPATDVYANSVTFDYLYRNEQIKGLLSDKQKDSYLQTGVVAGLLNLNWSEYDLGYTDDAGVDQKFIPDGYMLMISWANMSGNLPALELLNGPSPDFDAPMGTLGRFAKSWVEKDPSARQILVENTFVPVLRRVFQIMWIRIF